MYARAEFEGMHHAVPRTCFRPPFLHYANELHILLPFPRARNLRALLLSLQWVRAVTLPPMLLLLFF